MRRLTFLLFIILYFSAYSDVSGQSKYVGKYSGSYTWDSCKISILLDLKQNGTFDLLIDLINTNTGKIYFDHYYLIPLKSEGKWFVKKGILFMTTKSTDTICMDGQTEYNISYIIGQNRENVRQRTFDYGYKNHRKTVKYHCEGYTHLVDETYNYFQFSYLTGKKPALEVRILADFYEQIWTGYGTYLVKE